MAGLLLVPFALLTVGRKMPTDVKDRTVRYWHAEKAEAKLKILVGLMSMLTRVHAVYEVSPPANVRELLSHLSLGISLGLDSVSSVLTCMGFRGYLSRLIFWILVPAIVTGAILLGTLVRLLYERRLSLSTLVERSLPLLVRALFVVYPL
jgi:hypothetical protein